MKILNYIAFNKVFMQFSAKIKIILLTFLTWNVKDICRYVTRFLLTLYFTTVMICADFNFWLFFLGVENRKLTIFFMVK